MNYLKVVEAETCPHIECLSRESEKQRVILELRSDRRQIAAYLMVGQFCLGEAVTVSGTIVDANSTYRPLSP